MAKPRVFVSSTYYDLKHIRSSLENFIDSLGFESILSEKGQIPYSPDVPLDESCYKEVGNADIFIIIIGGRYGSEKSGSEEKTDKSFFERYDSITKQEYKSAVDKDVPTYILIDKSVYSEYKIFLKNKNNELINYSQVDSVNIFHLIENILLQPKNNPVHQFDRYNDIEVWLKEQWAGLFRDLINQRSKQTQIASLSSQVSTLAEINITLKRYLEEVILKVSPEGSAKLIAEESKRLDEGKQLSLLKDNSLFNYFDIIFSISIDDFRDALIKSKSREDFVNTLLKSENEETRNKVIQSFLHNNEANTALNKARKIMGLDPFNFALDLKNKKKKTKDVT